MEEREEERLGLPCPADFAHSGFAPLGGFVRLTIGQFFDPSLPEFEQRAERRRGWHHDSGVVAPRRRDSTRAECRINRGQ